MASEPRTGKADNQVAGTDEVLQRTDLSMTAKVVYAEIVDRIGKNGVAWPNYSQLAASLGTTERAVRRAVAHLLELEEPLLKLRNRRKRGCINRYALPDVSDSEKRTDETSDVPPGVRTDETSDRSDETSDQNGRCVRFNNQTKNQTHQPDQESAREPSRKQAPAKRPSARDPASWERASEHLVDGVLKTDAFEAKWNEWTTFRSELGKPLRTDATVRKQIRDLEKWGHDDACKAIDESIGHQWTGLFKPDAVRGARPFSASRLEAKPGKYSKKKTA
jgi:hypothetical protein